MSRFHPTADDPILNPKSYKPRSFEDLCVTMESLAIFNMWQLSLTDWEHSLFLTQADPAEADRAIWNLKVHLKLICGDRQPYHKDGISILRSY